ncbi:MAG: ABC transporter ATP-binding protein [Humidesulfovibrio sp.]|uniref:metal ABC transporter ATP-binding protein n=1 Tax=Humidesulfovibrio sp. TaxID=2910988 RepID=UPI002735B252|nr:ABC transporter ATP-binding protein [Humidesulfovibrio sp.]MDP2846947.1 ABC transporter ATP-binding protein [Humidesulfovibrio sp.]
MNTPAIEISDLWFAYDGVRVLEQVNLTLPAGDFLAVLGPNGGGKSTLLKLLLGLARPGGGSLRVLGQSPGDAGGRIGYLPQFTQVSASFPITVLGAVSLGLVRPGLDWFKGRAERRREREAALQALERVGLADHAGRRLSDLSGGQRQRAFIARAIVSGPELLLLDEPTASVDGRSRQELMALLAKLNRDMTIVMVSHDMSTVDGCVKSIACVNRSLHHHPDSRLTPEIFAEALGVDQVAGCPVELLAHGPVPHRVVFDHDNPDCCGGRHASNDDRGQTS